MAFDVEHGAGEGDRSSGLIVGASSVEVLARKGEVQQDEMKKRGFIGR